MYVLVAATHRALRDWRTTTQVSTRYVPVWRWCRVASIVSLSLCNGNLFYVCINLRTILGRVFSSSEVVETHFLGVVEARHKLEDTAI